MVRRTLRVERSLSAAQSEKGDPARPATSFPPNSIFHAVETSIYPKHRWLCCLDLGDEWADYLCIETDGIIFVHCKHAKPTTSAAAFHEVIGQALKNLSRAQSTPAEFIAKLSATRKTKYWAGRRIRRLRAGAQWPAFEQGVTSLIGTPTAGREVHIVQTMFSKRAFDQAAVSRPPHFIQLVGLLATFIGSCLEKAAKPVIICPP